MGAVPDGFCDGIWEASAGWTQVCGSGPPPAADVWVLAWPDPTARTEIKGAGAGEWSWAVTPADRGIEREGERDKERG